MSDTDSVFSVEGGAKFLKVSRSYMYELIKSEAIKPIPNFSPTRIARQELERFLAEGPAHTTAA